MKHSIKKFISDFKSTIKVEIEFSKGRGWGPNLHICAEIATKMNQHNVASHTQENFLVAVNAVYNVLACTKLSIHQNCYLDSFSQ